MEQLTPASPEQLDYYDARNRASALAGQLPDMVLEARRLSHDIRNGAHGVRNAGEGELFWQHRRLQSGEAMTRVDWKRSAKSDHLYIREYERLSPQHIWIWFDLSSSMHYASEAHLPTKAKRCLTLGLALADIAAYNGDFVGIPGRQPLIRGQNVAERFCDVLANQLSQTNSADYSNMTAIPPEQGVIFILSDFWSPGDQIINQIKQLASLQTGVLARILDPAEQAISYRDRTRFIDSETGQALLVDDPNDLSEDFTHRYQDHENALVQASRATGWPLVLHQTANPALEGMVKIIHAHNDGAM